jgi:MFS family permease
MTYEGARGITGPFMATLGASASAVGIVAGLGELIGYALRLVSGYLADRTRRYWAITLWGYGLNLLAVPLLALAGRWETAAGLIVAERLGKAVRTPPRDVLLSHAASRMGGGRAFGLHEALDQIGAVAGPLVVAFVLYVRASYRVGFALLLVPALLALAVLGAARLRYPQPDAFEASPAPAIDGGYPRVFWIYLVSVAFLAAGYADFPLIAFHLKKLGIVADGGIPLFYAGAMGVDALAALVLGRLFDRRGLPILIAIPLVSFLFAPLAFSRSFGLALAGTVVWGLGMGAQESIVRAAVATMVPPERRGTAYGVFNSVYGVAWFAGSALMGLLYDRSVASLVMFSMLSQLAAVPVLWVARDALRSFGPRR